MYHRFPIKYRYRITSGKWVAVCPKLPGLLVEAKGREEARLLIEQHIPGYVREKQKAKRSRQAMPSKVTVGDDLNWNAPWVEVCLCVELPFWLMINTAAVNVEVEGHSFPVNIEDAYFELYGQKVLDSGATVLYQGPLRRPDDLPADIQALGKVRPDMALMWRKCKTVLRVLSRCNEDAWNVTDRRKDARSWAAQFYMIELCRAHIPVINRLIQRYRLATYDYFAYEVAPWDVPRWFVRRGSQMLRAQLVPYREWDMKPVIFSTPGGQPALYQLLDAADFAAAVEQTASAGEFELLDSLNLMERGDYSGAVRRVTTAIEVLVERLVGDEIEAAEGKAHATKFLRKTRVNFNARLLKYEDLSKRRLSDMLRTDLNRTRELRHRIVHQGYRISPGERGRAQRAVDMGRWTFSWLENDPARRDVREKRIALRSRGRGLSYGVFPTKITREGVLVSPPP